VLTSVSAGSGMARFPILARRSWSQADTPLDRRQSWRFALPIAEKSG
jgi:hypothetical protein